MIAWLEQLLGDVEGLIQTAIAVAAAAYVASVWWRTKALVPTLTALVVSSVVVWAAHNVAFLRQQVEETAVEAAYAQAWEARL